jgi:hypothetical protein
MEDDPVTTTLRSACGTPVFGGSYRALNAEIWEEVLADLEEWAKQRHPGYHDFGLRFRSPAYGCEQHQFRPYAPQERSDIRSGRAPAYPLEPSRRHRGASPGSTNPSGLSVKEWRRKVLNVKRSNSNGFDDVFGTAAPPPPYHGGVR